MAGTQGIEVSVGKLLEQYKAQFESALPKHMRIEHFMRCAMTYIKKNPTVGKCTAVSICKSLMDAAQLGLAPDGLLGSAYLVPFNNKVKDEGGGEHWEMTCQLIPGYRGMIDLARRSGQILDIQARPVLKGEDFNLDWGRPQPLSHQPDLDANPAEDQGKNVRGVYAIAFYRDGSQHIEYMSRAEIEGIQRRSKANSKGFSPWQSDWVEMARKTVVKRLAKYLPLSPELSRAIEIDNDAGEIIKDADVVMPQPEEKPVSKTDALKNRLAHKPETPVQEQLDDAAEKRESAEEAAADTEADRAAARARLEAPAERKPEPAKEAKPEPDEPLVAETLTRDEKVFVRMLGKKPVRSKVFDMTDEDMSDAKDAALADLNDPDSSRDDKQHAMGVIALLEAEAAKRAGAKA